IVLVDLGKTGNVGVLQQIGTMTLITTMADCQTNFMQIGSPAQQVTVITVQSKLFSHIIKHFLCSLHYTLCLFAVGTITSNQGMYRTVSNIFMLETAQQVIHDPFT